MPPTLFEAAPDGLAVVEQDGVIALVNGQVETMFGYRREELLGQSIDMLIPEQLRGAHVRHRDSYMKAPRARPMGEQLTLFGRRKDGSQFPVEISLSPIEVERRQLVMAIIRDVTRRKQLEMALQASVRAAETHLHLLQTVLDQLPSGVYLVRSHDAKLTLANRAAVTLWGATWNEGQPMASFLARTGIRFLQPTGQPYPLEHLPSIQALRAGKEVVQAQMRILRPDGVSIPLLVTSVPLPASIFLGGANEPGDASDDESGRERMALVVYQDVTMLAEAERVKDEFVTLAAHELRTPIAVASGYAQMLLRAPGGQEGQEGAAQEAPLAGWQEEALRDINTAMSRLTALTDDLLDVTRLQAGQLQLSKEPHDLVALARRICHRMQTTTARHEIQFETHAKHLIVDIDVRRIEQALHNLINNAIKYSPAGGVVKITLRRTESVTESVTESYAEQGASRRGAEMTVEDHGLGIPEDQQGIIFQRFVRARNAQELGIEGTGLGLYLCREILAAHDGRIWFESREGQGTTFHVLIPLLDLTERE
ncbi:MAG TPA: PAS domain S-box protein [Ktedonobacterales bacterium]|nr:PAS domain S-box protein [Ktedonobacterales bacterium]